MAETKHTPGPTTLICRHCVDLITDPEDAAELRYINASGGHVFGPVHQKCAKEIKAELDKRREAKATGGKA